MAAKKTSNQHQHAAKASALLERAKIPELRRDEHGNPWIGAADLPKLPPSLKSTYEANGQLRICLRLYPQ